jgi:hypothetical protein
MSTVRRVEVMATAMGVAIALAGCGGSGDTRRAPDLSNDTRAILATIDTLQAASRQDDARRICDDIFTASLAQSIHDASKHSCEAEVRDTLTSPDAQLSVSRKVDVKGSRATASVREQNGEMSTVSFVKVAERWRIERITPLK